MTTSVLVVDDEIIIAAGIEKRLGALGYSVAGIALSGEEAVQKAFELRPDIILMDINLGAGIDGVEAARLIGGQAGIPVVFLTALSDDATIQRAKLTESFGFVLKPYEDGDLRSAIEIGLYKHKTDRQLRKKRQRLAATLNSIGDGVIVLDSLGRVSSMNPLAERLTGWAQADAVGRDVAEVFRIVEAATRNTVANPALTAMATGENVCLAENTILIRKDGSERYIDDSGAPIRDEGGPSDGAVLVFRDITERRLMKEQLWQARKMEAIGRMAGGMAHEFNSLMTAVIGFGEMLRDESLPADQRRNAVATICSAGNRAAELTRQILAYSRRQILIPSVLNLNDVVRETARTFRRFLREEIDFQTRLAPDLGRVRVDPDQIVQVLLNLADNACDAMPRGGRLVIATMNEELGESATRLHPDATPGHYVVVSVSDTGTGMIEEVLAQAFEPFFTTKAFGSGHGLGLALVHGVVSQSGGHIEVTSAPGAGTTVRMFLPRVDEPPAPASDSEPAPKATRLETILVADDEYTVRKYVKISLERLGYRVFDAPNGTEAVRLAATLKEPIRLLVTDLMMPGLSGREVAMQLAVSHPGIRTLYMSGYTEDDSPQKGLVADTTDFLHKPFTPRTLAEAVRNLLDRP